MQEDRKVAWKMGNVREVERCREVEEGVRARQVREWEETGIVPRWGREGLLVLQIEVESVSQGGQKIRSRETNALKPACWKGGPACSALLQLDQDASSCGGRKSEEVNGSENENCGGIVCQS